VPVDAHRRPLGTRVRVTGAPALRDQVALLIRKGALHGTAPEATAALILEAVEEKRAARCQDGDCARLFPHSRMSWHLPRHEAKPPFKLFVFARLCSRCGYRRRHRVHRVRKQEATP